MLRLNNAWPAGITSDMVKTFAESVLELTDPLSPASYRHRTLSTTAKAYELLEHVEDVAARTIPKPALNPIIAEYRESIQSDPVIASILDAKGIPLRALLLSEQDSLEKMTASLRIYGEAIEPSYTEAAERIIVQTCTSTKREKAKLRQCTDLYISHLVGKYISREFLRILALREFASIAIDSTGMQELHSFISATKATDNRFDIAFNMDAASSKFLSVVFPVDSFENADQLPAAFMNSMKTEAGVDTSKPFVLVKSVPGPDPFTAVRSFKYLLDMVQAFLFVFPDGTKWHAPMAAYVSEPSSGGVYRVAMNEFVNEGGRIKDARFHATLITKMTRFTFDRLDARGIKSGRKIMSALQAASAASRIRENDVRLLSIWSAFEALLPIPMKDGESTVRINHFTNYLAPLASARYARNLFYCFFEDLSNNYRVPLNAFLAANGKGKSRFQKFLSVFFLDKGKRSAFTSIFGDSELMKYRAHELYKLANDPTALLRRITDHERRVSWQLHRIYRVRNQIVHSARPTRFTPHLTENAFGYFKALVTSLVEVGERVSISESDALIDLCLSMCEDYKDRLATNKDRPAREFLELAAKGPFEK